MTFEESESKGDMKKKKVQVYNRYRIKLYHFQFFSNYFTIFIIKNQKESEKIPHSTLSHKSHKVGAL